MQRKLVKNLMLVLTLVVLCVVVGVTASAKMWGDYEYTVLADGTVEITEYTGNATELTIPAVIDGKAVTTIGKYSSSNFSAPFYDCDTLVSVTIPEGVTHIGPYAFAYCDNLQTITIPNSLSKLGHCVFLGTPFYANQGEWKGIFYVISGCAVGINYDLTTEMYIPAEVRIISDDLYTVTDFPIIETFAVDKNNPYFSVDEYGVLYDKNKTKLICYPEALDVKEYTVPDTVEYIDVFLNYYLETLIIPNSVDKINELIGLSFEDVYIKGEKTEINEDLCFHHVDHNEWMNRREEYSNLCKKYGLKAVKEELTPEEAEIFWYKVDELHDAVWLDEAAPYGTIHCYPGSTAEAYAKSKGINCEYIIDDVKVKDETTGITAVFAPEVFDTEVEMTIVESCENADIAFKKLFDTYKSYDITFKSNGVEVQPNGKVTIKIPISFMTNLMALKVYYVDEKGNTTPIDSRVEDGYIIFETDHFSEYVIVDTSDKHEHSYVGVVAVPATHLSEGVMTYTCSCDDSYTESIGKLETHSHSTTVTLSTCTEKGFTTYTCECGDTYNADYVDVLDHKDADSDYKCDYGCGYEFEKPAEPDTPSAPIDDCSCNCHAGGIKAFFFKLINFFQKLFGKNKVCVCGVKH